MSEPLPESDEVVAAFDAGAFDGDIFGGGDATAAELPVAEPFVEPLFAGLCDDASLTADPLPPEAALAPPTGHCESPLPAFPPVGFSHGVLAPPLHAFSPLTNAPDPANSGLSLAGAVVRSLVPEDPDSNGPLTCGDNNPERCAPCTLDRAFPFTSLDRGGSVTRPDPLERVSLVVVFDPDLLPEDSPSELVVSLFAFARPVLAESDIPPTARLPGDSRSSSVSAASA